MSSRVLGSQGQHRLFGTVPYVLWLLVTLVLLLVDAPIARALWPSLTAIGLAFATREIYSSLLLGALAGAALLRGGNPFGAFALGWLDVFSKYLLQPLTSRWNISVLVFTLMMGGLVELLRRNGGMEALAQLFLRGRATRRRAELTVFGMGWLLFVDGLANSLLVGKTMRSTADRAGVSREKLAFLVDSTSSPIASIALVSTWIVTEMTLIRDGLNSIPLEVQVASREGFAALSPYGLLLQSLPYRFYSIFLLLLVLFLTLQRRDLGPMLEAQRRVGLQRAKECVTDETSEGGQGRTDTTNSSALIAQAIIPLFVLISGVFGGLFVQGGGLKTPFSLANSIQALGNAEADLVFVCACATAVLAAFLTSWMIRTPTTDGNTQFSTFLGGMNQMFLPALILVFAWCLNAVIAELGTAQQLVQLLEGRVPVVLLPGALFLTAALVSFCTGTSWGTMALVLPLAVPLAATLAGPSHALLPASIGAVLAGSVFGDHCSPLSDTTLVSAFASGCDTMDHIHTQLPYALLAAGTAITLGYLPAAYGAPAPVLLALGALFLWAIVRIVGREA